MMKHNNMPVHAPLYPSPFVPYECMDQKSIFAYLRVDETVIKRYLEDTPFDYVDNILFVSITDFSNCDKIPYMDCALTIPVKYDDTYGGYFLYEYENHDAAIAAGRELWGYPKKYADITLDHNGANVTAKATRYGKEIIRLECNLEETIEKIPDATLTPHLNIHAFPNPNKPGIHSTRITSRDTSPDFQTKEKYLTKVTVHLQGLETDPLGDLHPFEVLGGGFTIGDFYATEENGWGHVIG
ncbi:hypothetical protein GLW08_11025 [Pontibacillus yanchengensis]|uniref:Uncharacterized protein n=1 Tax=Pontibacillus yanchengensis TaxID=462910 RepID=A0ACC7VGG4_9BACI|nr:acetoacetate decarboxylase family protein [Pontibacillus yanchengensis]MYL53868.1 hypothetical protein [Pontibacillus yanchengensis]